MIPGIVKYESVNFPNFPRMEDSFGLVQSDSMDLQNDRASSRATSWTKGLGTEQRLKLVSEANF